MIKKNLKIYTKYLEELLSTSFNKKKSIRDKKTVGPDITGQIKPKAVWVRNRFSQKNQTNEFVLFVVKSKKANKTNLGRIYGVSIFI